MVRVDVICEVRKMDNVMYCNALHIPSPYRERFSIRRRSLESIGGQRQIQHGQSIISSITVAEERAYREGQKSMSRHRS
jgi:hypothetical protein